MSTLQVLCPNGRRQNVKTTPNTKLLQVLEEVCQKQKFMPPEDYKLVHGRNSLDLTLSVRFSNLSNNAKLELVKLEKSRAETEVVIALQLENGERLQHSFSPGTTLWDILQHWENVPHSKLKGELTSIDGSHTPALHPVCIYMTEEACGETVLRNTSLRKLGLLGGRAVIRYVKRPVDDKVISEAAEKSAKETLQKHKRDQNAVKRQTSTSELSGSQTSTQSTSFQTGSQSTGSQSTGSDQSNLSTIHTQQQITETQSGSTIDTQSGTRILATTSNVSTDGKTELATISLNINVNIQNDKTSVVREAESLSDEPAPKMVKTDQSADLSEPMEVEHTDIADTVMETEDSVKEPSEELVQTRQNQEMAAESIRNLNIPGLEVFTPQDFQDLTPDQQQVAQQLAAALLPKLLGRPGQSTPVNKNPRPTQQSNKQRALPQPTADFTDFKFPEETKGKQLYKNELSEYKKEDYQPCERNTVVYSLLEKQEKDADANITVKYEDIPGDFFEVTDSDIKSLVSAQKKKLDEMENQPLMTSAMRKAKLESMYSRYERVVIRVQFTDKLVLQGFFRPRETVYAVQKFVKASLKDKEISFYLYTSPPKCVLKDESQTLIEAHLVPATIVYFGSSKQEDHYLSDSVLSNIKTRLDADQLAAECLQSSESSQSNENQSSSSGKGKQPASSRAQYKNSQQATSDEKPSTSNSRKDVPKWFKIGKK